MPLREALPPARDLPDAAAPARQRRKETRPQELLDAALTLFVEKGFAATRAEEVAQRAGVSKGTLYLYYPSKEELFKAVVRQNLSSLIAAGQELAEHFEGSTGELLQCLMQTWLERVVNTPAGGIHKVVLAEVRNFPELAQFYSDEVIKPADRMLCGAVQRGIDRGEFRALPVHDVAQALLAPVIFMALHRHSFGECPVHGGIDVDPASTLATHLELTLRGLEPRPVDRSPTPRIPVARKTGRAPKRA
jgi:AcrR family transcriptional regulator